MFKGAGHGGRNGDGEGLSISSETEVHLVSLLNQLCSRLMEKENAKLLDVFFQASQTIASLSMSESSEEQCSYDADSGK